MAEAFTPADLTPIERTYLGVLATGMVPARLAQDPWLRMDYVTAVCLAIVEGRPPETYVVGEGPAVTPEFNRALTEAALTLDDKGIIAAGSPPPDVLGGPDIMRPKPPPVIDFDQHPRIWDRYLAHECLEELFGDARVYPFLMGKYQESGAVWARLYQQNPERFQ